MNAKKILAVLTATTLAFSLTACEKASENAREGNERQRKEGVEQIVTNQPVKPMSWSPTRDTVNRWAETWGQEGKVSYVYMQTREGKFAGYYVISGLPVNYCVSATPVDEINTSISKSVDRIVTTAPALDGAYYGGCDASRYYGFDAVTGQYVEWTDGNVLTAVLSDQPLPLDKQPVAYGSSIEDVKTSK